MLRVIFLLFVSQMAVANPFPLKTEDIVIRDPFIYVDEQHQLYYMYAQNGNRSGDFEAEPRGVEVYTSKDLHNWSQPKQVLTLAENTWARKWVWAPEVFVYGGKFYLFVTLTSDDLQPGLEKPGWISPIKRFAWPDLNKRGTQVFVAEKANGPFLPFADKPHTPESQLALDGTLFVEDNKPYMLYCHEWVQIEDGSVAVIALKDDLSRTTGEAVKLFNASEAPWARADAFTDTYVTDGVFMHKTQTGKLVMIWSSFGDNGYALGQAVSDTGSVFGPWTQLEQPLFAENGGHGMLFRNLQGELMLALHQPNDPHGAERLHLFAVDDSGDHLKLKH